MWLLENKEAFQGRRLWLRPGKTYLFGRTVAEAGQLVVSHNTISRKHLTITIDPVNHGDAQHPSRRSRVTIEDLATKLGTVVNGNKVKGSKHVVENGQDVDFTMGKCPNKFRLFWSPVVFTFSFSGKELQAKPIDSLRTRFEQLDIKLIVDYSIDSTTHVVAKKRNTAKGLQALINGKHVVTESFLDAVAQAAKAVDDGSGSQTCALEQNFDECWPDPMKHLPPRGGEPFEHPDEIYAPDTDRLNVFEGYTFIFYDATQHNNLLAPITNGGGKAMLEKVKPVETLSDDFVRFVKSVAGEKGLGSFEDGSEGKGVVVVRYLPAKGPHLQWYTEFITAVSLRLDHRPIEQNEFLEAILIKDASMLRRPLQVEGQSGASDALHAASTQPTADEPEQTTRRPRVRKPVKRRFMGFDDGSDVDMDEAKPAAPAETKPQNEPSEEGGLFVSQEPSQDLEGDGPVNITQKRAAPIEDDLMEGMAPAAARFKRQKIAMGGAFAQDAPEVPPTEPVKPATTAKKKKGAREIDVLAEAARHREEQEARARAEREDLARLPDDVDLAEIRRLHIVEEMELRRPPAAAGRTRDQDIADGRWDPRWNGVKNFKKFRRRGEVVGRQPARTIIGVDEVRSKTFGVGDDYWLEDEVGPSSRTNMSGGTTTTTTTTTKTQTKTKTKLASIAAPRSESPAVVLQISEADDDDDGDNVLEEEEEEDDDEEQVTSAAAQTAGQSLGKRPANDDVLSSGPSSKRQRLRQRQSSSPPPSPPAPVVEVDDSQDESQDGSEDELKFRFGRRR